MHDRDGELVVMETCERPPGCGLANMSDDLKSVRAAGAGPAGHMADNPDRRYFAMDVEAFARCFKASAIAFSTRGFKIA